MRQFFRGSGIVAFFYTVVSIFSAMAVSLAVQVDERNIKFAIYYGELSDTDSAATDAAFDRKILITVFLAISALLLINIFSVTDHWTREKREKYEQG